MFRPCVLIPTYDNPRTIRRVVEAVREHGADVVVVDDGSGAEGKNACAELAADGLAHVVHRPSNGGKGAAVKTGFEAAFELGYSHALQVDADGQHNLGDLPRFLEVAEQNPDALVLGCPVFDETAPKGRQIARKISIFWVNLETGGPVIVDPMCGFRVYPLADAVAVQVPSQMMDFDPEIAVRLVWRGLPVINLETRVRYMGSDEGGVSHFHLFKDNLLISWMHTRLCVEKIFGLMLGRGRYRGTVRELGPGA
ncbi:MAG TPA: glycosyltransferase family 2 protein [Polyangiaceae bacterium]|nr:glycosyltransferase family 2 protein [Polyangiaceae bacterium]